MGLLAERPELAVHAVHELMRYSPVILNTMRVPVEDVELAGVRIPAGTLVIANTAAANRDPASTTNLIASTSRGKMPRPC